MYFKDNKYTNVKIDSPSLKVNFYTSANLKKMYTYCFGKNNEVYPVTKNNYQI